MLLLSCKIKKKTRVFIKGDVSLLSCYSNIKERPSQHICRMLYCYDKKQDFDGFPITCVILWKVFGWLVFHLYLYLVSHLSEPERLNSKVGAAIIEAFRTRMN